MLFSPIEPFESQFLNVGDGHTLYVEQCGNPSGKPVVMLHGGPGGGANPTMRRFHDPERYRIILFDQRGCGRSRPHASLDHNTTWHLVADIERIRAHYGIEAWQVFGGSWGSTLALAYAQTHPDRVTELVLRGIFTLRRAEIDWFYSNGCNWLFPDAYQAFRDLIPENERDDLIAAYYRRLTGDDPKIMQEAARIWSQWEGSTLSIQSNPDRVAAFGADRYALAFARIECHYFQHGGFLDSDDQLHANMHRIRHIPGTIIHGRFDVVTPVRTAWELSNRWPEADLRIISEAGHAMTEPGIMEELVGATNRYA